MWENSELKKSRWHGLTIRDWEKNLINLSFYWKVHLSVKWNAHWDQILTSQWVGKKLKSDKPAEMCIYMYIYISWWGTHPTVHWCSLVLLGEDTLGWFDTSQSGHPGEQAGANYLCWVNEIIQRRLGGALQHSHASENASLTLQGLGVPRSRW